MVHVFVGIVFIMFILQGVFSYFQIKHFKKTLSDLKAEGTVLIGREKGILNSGCIVIIVLNQHNKVINFKQMKGFTVFQRFKLNNEYIGMSANELKIIIQERKSNIVTKAIKKALSSYVLSDIKEGETVG